MKNLVLFWNSYDSDSFREQCSGKDVLYLDTDPTYIYKSSGGDFEAKRWLQFKSRKLNYLLYPVKIIADNMQLFMFVAMANVFFDRPIERVIYNHLYHTPAFWLLKLLRIIKSTVWVSGDWLGESKTRRGIWSVFNAMAFRVMDLLAVRLSDKVLSVSYEIAQARRELVKSHILKDSVYNPPIKQLFRGPIKANRKKILFLGMVRHDSMIAEIVRAICSITGYEFTLKIAGMPGEVLYETRAVEYIGEFKREDLPEIAADCFCGVNLISKESYSQYTVPAKMIDYLQLGLPVLCSSIAGPMAKTIESKAMGMRLPYSIPDQIQYALKYMYRNRNMMRRNIVKYLKTYKAIDIADYFVK